MQLPPFERLARPSITIISLLAIAGCFGEGDGQKRLEGTAKPPLIGMLVDAPVSGVDWQTNTGGAGLTDGEGQFEYQPGDRITFSIGSITLGTTSAAPLLTAVELTGSNVPTDRAALNLLVFLQSIDTDQEPDNGITVSAATRASAQGMTLDFTSPDFRAQVATVVNAIASGNRVVSDDEALLHFYETYLAFGGTDSFNFLFPGFPPVGGGVGFELVFSDEFNSGDAPSPEKWNYETGYGDNGWGNNEWQLYTDSRDNVRVEDGNLVISALCPTPPCGVRDGTVTSGRINTLDKFEFKYGKVIARIKPPVGKAAWPAFWSLGANFPTLGWPRSGEIDFMEMHNAFSDDRTSHFTIHWCDQTIQAPLTCSFPDGHRFITRQQPFPVSLGDDFHVFEADWTENRIIGKIDGIEYFNEVIDPVTMEEFRRDFFLILNVAMGGTLGSNGQPPDGTETFPQTMLVDYVRVFQRVGGEDPAAFSIDFEQSPESYDFGASGGFGGGASEVIANPVPGGINTSAQVARMRKFMGDDFGGSLLTLPTPLDVALGTSFTMKVYSTRVVDVTLKLEGATDSEVTVAHGGSGWEELRFDHGAFSGLVEGLSFIFDLGTPGDAGGDPTNWTFYYDDIRLVPPDTGGPGLSRIDLPVTFEDPTVDYTLTDFGTPVPVSTTLIIDPIDSDNIVASTTKPPGAPTWAGTTIGTAAGFATPIPFSAATTTIGLRVFSPDAGIPVRLKAENALDDTISVETEVLTTAAGRWETLVFDFSAEVEGPALDLDAVYDKLSVFFNFGTDGNTAGEKTYLWDDVEFGVPLPVIDATAPILTRVTYVSSNANPAFARIGDEVTVTLAANEPIRPPTVTIAGATPDSVSGSGANWQASRTITGDEPGTGFLIAYSDLAGNAGTPVSAPTDTSGVTLDFVPPSVSISGAPAVFSSLDALSLTFLFSEPVVGFALADISITNGVAAGFTTLDAMTYRANVTPDGTGDLIIGIGAGAASDTAGNPNLPATPITVANELDADAPRLTLVGIASSNANPAYARAGDVVTITMTANEEIDEPVVTFFMSGVPADSVTGSGTDWQATRTLLASDPEGVIEFAIEFQDIGGNPGPRTTITTSPFPTVTFDVTPPELTFIDMPATIDTLDSFLLTFSFDEAVAGFEAGDIVVENGSADLFEVLDAATYRARITPSDSGDLTVAVAADVASDLAGNQNLAAAATATLNLVPFWQLVWSDEFTGSVLNASRWTARTDAGCPAPCEGLQSYRTERVGVAGGVLLLEARDDGVAPDIYTSGLVDTLGKRAMRYGRIEIDARLPGALGTRPSLWLAPVAEAYGPWPLSGAIDIVNAPDLGSGGETTLEHTLVYGLPEPEQTVATATSPAPATVSTEFSTYALEWEAGELRWFVDGEHVATQVQDNWYAYFEDADGVYTLGTAAEPFDEDFYLVFNLGVGAAGGSGYPHTLAVDAVRVYQCANADDPAAGTGCAGLIDAVDPAIDPVVATPPPYDDSPYTELLEVYTDAPAVLNFENDSGATAPGTLEADIFADAGVTVASALDAPDGANTVWNLAIGAGSGTAGGAGMGVDLSPSTGFFDLSGAETAGELLFRMRVNSASVDALIAARLDSSAGSGSFALDYVADGTWRQYSVKIADLVMDSVMAGTTLNLADLTYLFAIEVSGGSANLDLDDISVKVACRDVGRCEATPRRTTPPPVRLYEESFETLNKASATALGDAGWVIFGAVFSPDGMSFIRGYSAGVPAPNGGPGFSAIVDDQGGMPQGTQQLSIYSDYGNRGDQGSGNRVEANVFQEWTIDSTPDPGEDDIDVVGTTITFSFDAKRGNINDPGDMNCTGTVNPPCDSTALAFIKTIDPATGFSLTNFEFVDMTATGASWGRHSVSLFIDAGLEGQLLQVGFAARAQNDEPSGVFYDNLVLEGVETGP